MTNPHRIGPPRATEFKLPEGFALGQRIRTNQRYAQGSKLVPYLEGVIIGGSRSQNGDLRVQWDTYKRPIVVQHTMVERL
jgi:hypothetical protein